MELQKIVEALGQANPLLLRPREEGWLRPKQNVAKPPYSAQTGWSLTNYVPRIHSGTWLKATTPAARKRRLRGIFLISRPPLLTRRGLACPAVAPFLPQLLCLEAAPTVARI